MTCLVSSVWTKLCGVRSKRLKRSLYRDPQSRPNRSREVRRPDRIKRVCKSDYLSSPRADGLTVTLAHDIVVQEVQPCDRQFNRVPGLLFMLTGPCRFSVERNDARIRSGIRPDVIREGPSLPVGTQTALGAQLRVVLTEKLLSPSTPGKQRSVP